MKRKIVVLFHENSTRISIRSSVVYDLARFWREMGHEVVFQFGVNSYTPADLVFVHVDLSVVPDKYLEYAQRYPAAVNGRIKDIRKSAFSENVVSPDEKWDGQVIVKTNLNYTGLPEYLLDYPKKFYRNALVMRCLHSLTKLVANPNTDFGSARSTYKLYNSIDNVPENLFFDRKFVVERFLPEKDGENYCLRMFLFFGDKFTCRRILSPDPIVKAVPGSRVESVEPHSVVYDWKKQFNIDYGKFDYVIHDGRPELLDINKTTGLGGKYLSGEQRHKGHMDRSSAIEEFFKS